ncbi:palmitoyltransferase akr1-like [Anneissia japonica]|uniref:palmitoyltransferase akr1-like n=1 Tax=Anneissia japonica TaxID=1529436 RepID=UPI0014258C90|nr:palmitoyltransferase akr1-like [Anneissia japonica]
MGIPGQKAVTHLLDVVQNFVSVVDIEEIIKRNPEGVNQKGWHGLTPLHKAGLRGDPKVTELLLKYGADVHAVNDYSETALHYACKNGNLLNIHAMTEHGGDVRQFDQNNRNTLHHAAMGGSVFCFYPHRHRALVKELSYWSKSKLQHMPPRGPLFTWYFLLFLPFVAMSCILLFGHYAGPYKGFFSIVATVFLSVFVSSKIHRMNHICRWPNPIHAGAFAAGILHTIICYVFLILPVLWPHFYALCFNIPALAVMLYLYVFVLISDPSVCRSSRPGPSLSEPYMTVEHIARGVCKSDDFCSVCEIIKPLNVKHCRLCDKCYYGLDHHCLFLLTCIAKSNHRFFIMLVALVVLAQFLFIGYGIEYILVLYDPLPDAIPLITTLIMEQSWFIVLAGLNAASIVWGVCLLSYQLRMIANGLTNFYHLHLLNNNVRRLSTYQKIQNLKNFLMGRKIVSAADFADRSFKV